MSKMKQIKKKPTPKKAPPPPPWTLHLTQRDRTLFISKPPLKKILRGILEELSAEHPEIVAREVSILFTGDDEIQEMNLIYRGKDKPTDVLSFAQYDGASGPLASPTLGDLVISLPITKKQAKRYGWSVSDELLRLLVHGALHLFGFDHENVSSSAAQKNASA